MKVALIDVDGRNFPNLALMKLAAWHKAQGDSVEWYDPLFSRPDRIYASKIFSFSADFLDYAAGDPEPIRHAVALLRECGFKREIFIYMLVTDIGDAETRLRALVDLNVIPFAQPYRDFTSDSTPTAEQRKFASFVNVKGGKLCRKKSFREYYK